jgi:hypothetical protein
MHLCIKDEMPYHSSAVYAAALHSISVPFRIEPLGPANSHNFSGAVDVYGVIQMLAGQARQNMVTILDVAMPAPPISGIFQVSFFFFFHLMSLFLSVSLVNC